MKIKRILQSNNEYKKKILAIDSLVASILFEEINKNAMIIRKVLTSENHDQPCLCDVASVHGGSRI